MKSLITFELDKASIAEKAYKLIKNLILTKEITGKINQEEIAKKLDISRTPIILSLNKLETEGFLESKPYKGFYIKKYSKKELDDINIVRLLFETYGLKKIIENLSEKEITIINNFLNKFKKYYDNQDIGKYRDLDIKFHSFIIKQTKNQYIIKQISDSILIPDISSAFIPIDISIKHHEVLVESIILKNFKKAKETIEDHISALIPNI